MSTVEKISISLPHEQANFIKAALASGDYANTSEVMRDALRALKYERLAREAALEELRAEVRRGRNSPAASDFSMDKLIAEYAGKAQP